MQQKRSWYVVVAVVALLAITIVGIGRAIAQLGAKATGKGTPISVGTRAPTKPPKATATPKPLLPALSVQGTQIIDANG
nr:hypothetical protein [Ktedonobacterales bacterium]